MAKMNKQWERDLEWGEAAMTMQSARIETLETALKASLAVLREWISRAQPVDGKWLVDVEDIEGAKRLYHTLLEAYGGLPAVG